MLELKSVTGGYGEKRVLNGVGLTVGESEIVALVGPNGSGKSTVLKSIFGMVKVDSGEVLLEGAPIHNRKPSLNASAGIGYIPQGCKVFDKLTVQENLEMGGVLIRDRALLKERIESMYAHFPNLKKSRHTIAGRLSGGERQMVGFCRGLVMNPRLLLVDEPTIGLAPMLVAATMDLIQNICENFNASVLIVEQNVASALKIARRVYLLSMGRVTHDEPVSESTEQRLRELFLA